MQWLEALLEPVLRVAELCGEEEATVRRTKRMQAVRSVALKSAEGEESRWQAPGGALTSRRESTGAESRANGREFPQTLTLNLSSRSRRRRKKKEGGGGGKKEESYVARACRRGRESGWADY
jgi:hypothetical protein